MNKIVLDTNGYVSYLSGDKNILYSLVDAEIIFMSIFVLGELLTGFKGGNREKDNLAILRTFLNKPGVSVLNASTDTADYFALIKNNLKKAGTPIPVNDIWIAAHTMQTGSMLITYDRHFKYIPGLRLWEKI